MVQSPRDNHIYSGGLSLRFRWLWVVALRGRFLNRWSLSIRRGVEA